MEMKHVQPVEAFINMVTHARWQAWGDLGRMEGGRQWHWISLARPTFQVKYSPHKILTQNIFYLIFPIQFSSSPTFSFCGFFWTFVSLLFNSREFSLHCKGKRCYRDPSSGDFTLNPESPAWLLGIAQVKTHWANILLNWINFVNDCFQKEKFPGGHWEHWSKKVERHWSTLIKPEIGTSHMPWLSVQ